jgi:hypothetical protein
MEVAMQITRTDEDGQITILFDSRWQYPELMGYKPTDPQYRCLQEMWRKVMGAQTDEEED